MLLSIPSPHTGVVHLGPLAIRMYGLMLLAGIAGCIWLTGRRWVRQGGDWDLVFRVAVWGVGFGIVGARLYHDITSWDEVQAIDAWWAPFAVWKGGLGVWGGILFGCLAGAVIVRRSGNSVFRFMDAAAPGLLLAQGIGRIGNWWNQELFGKPTDLPWGLEIDPEHRPVDHLADATFHPTFLYELVYDCAMVARAAAARPPLPLQAAGAVRALREHLHVRPLLRGAAADRPVAPHSPGSGSTAWVSIVVFVLSTAFFIWWQFFHRGRAEALPPPRRTTGPTMAIPRGRR